MRPTFSSRTGGIRSDCGLDESAPRSECLVASGCGDFEMAIDALVLPLLNVPLFQGLKPLQLTEIARRADRIVYKPGDVIVTAHGEPDGAVLVVSGEAVRTEGPGLEDGGKEDIPA